MRCKQLPLISLLDCRRAGSPAAGLAWSIKDLCTSSACLYAASSLPPTVHRTARGQVVLQLSLGGVYPHPLQPPTFSLYTPGPTIGPRVRNKKLHPILMSLAPGKDENFGCWERDLM
jgi:hypothetical protein